LHQGIGELLVFHPILPEEDDDYVGAEEENEEKGKPIGKWCEPGFEGNLLPIRQTFKEPFSG